MSVETEPVPPVPQHTPPINKKDPREPFENNWMQWFLQLRDKINIIDSAIVNLGNVSGIGLVVKNGVSWFTRTITGTAGRISVADGDGVSGNPTIDLITTAVTPGSYTNTNITVDAYGRITAAASGSSGTGTDAFTTLYEFWDFVKHGFSTSTNTGSSFVTTSGIPVVYTLGAGAGATLTGEAARPGILSLTTGTTNTGRARVFFTIPVILMGSGEITYRTKIRLPILSDVTNRYTAQIVMTTVISGTPQILNVSYADDVNAGQWVAYATDGVGTTTTNTTIAPAANTWVFIKMVVNAAGTSMAVSIGADASSAVLAGTVSANIPSVALGLGIFITKSTGTTARTLDVDVVDFMQVFTTPR